MAAPLRMLAGLGLLAGYLTVAGWRHRRRPRSLLQRLAHVPTEGAPVREEVTIRWDDHHVPFIEARHDRDLAVGLGVVHAHLRLAQMELMRRAAQGRLSEVLGPAALDLDHVLRILDLGRAAPDIVATMPRDTRVWLEGFADGVNHVIASELDEPEEFKLLGMKAEPWSLADLVGLGRLASVDFSWKIWIRLLKLRGRPDWVKVWDRLLRDTGIPVPSLAGGFILPSRTGSNSVAVAGRRSTSGGALIASDPHLSIVLPNLWLLAGCRSPSYHMVGLMIPGVPAVAEGRNPWIAWGGTSLHAASSELFDIGDLPEDEIQTRRETVHVRWWPKRRVRVRDTAYGPVVSDSPLVAAPPDRRLALHWVGHLPSDEMTALLRLNRARDWDGFLGALDGFAVPAQNMTFADSQGRVGIAMAAKLPARPHTPPEDIIVPRDNRRHWGAFVTARDLPARLDPDDGFVASANNRPQEETRVPVGWFFSPPDRVRRLSQLLRERPRVSVHDLTLLQRDVTLPAALELRDRLLVLAGECGQAERTPELIQTLRDWDGRYDEDAAGPVAFEVLIYSLLAALHGKDDLMIYGASWEPWGLLRDDLEQTPRERLAEAMAAALPPASETLRRHRRWGEMHRLRLTHALSVVPGIGRRYRFADLPASGSNETVMKTAYGFSIKRHSVQFGANARHISDMADPDANYFVLLGGQDGQPSSATFLDQLPLWRKGAYIRLPLGESAVRALFRHRTVLRPPA